MANIFQRIGAAVGRVFSRDQSHGEEVGRAAEARTHSAEQRGFREKMRDFFSPGRAERERLERELATAREREALAQEARERAEQAAREAQETVQHERERAEQARAPQVPDFLKDIPPVMPIGPKGVGGVVYSSGSSEILMQRLDEAVAIGKRVSVRVHTPTGWQDLFLNDGKHARQKGRGISADHLRASIQRHGGVQGWIESGADVGESGGYEIDDEVDGYQLCVY